MTTFVMLVGLPGSGKGWYAKQLQKDFAIAGEGSAIYESDAFRKSYYGDESIQGDNQKLFEIMHGQMITALKNNVNVIFDATNIIAKHRIEFLQKINKLDVEKKCYIIATPIDECIENNNKRERVVPEYVIINMYKQFQCPNYNEGWDKILFVNNICKEENIFKYVDILETFYKDMLNFKQDNPNHTMTLGKHCDAVYEKLPDIITNDVDNLPIALAAQYHDIGKLYTKTFFDANGNPSEYAHYFGHENVGAYEMMLYQIMIGFLNSDEIVLTCNLIQYHMRPYNMESEKSKQKFLNLVGQEIYDGVMIIYNVDKESK